MPIATTPESVLKPAGEPEILSPERRAQILAGATEVFEADGYEGASMSRIAARAGVSKGTLYNYFPGKSDLFVAFVRRQCGQCLQMVFENADADHNDPATVLRDIGLRLQRLMYSPAGLATYRVVVSEAGKFPELAAAFFEAGPAVTIRHLSAWLDRQRRAGRLALDDPSFAAEQFLALCRTRYGQRRELQLLTNPPDAGLEQVVDAAVAMFLAFYKPAI